MIAVFIDFGRITSLITFEEHCYMKYILRSNFVGKIFARRIVIKILNNYENIILKQMIF